MELLGGGWGEGAKGRLGKVSGGKREAYVVLSTIMI